MVSCTGFSSQQSLIGDQGGGEADGGSGGIEFGELDLFRGGATGSHTATSDVNEDLSEQ